jgi:hypothetical protein
MKTVQQYELEVADLLTPKCPRCQAAFIDFDGCTRLQCRRCPTQFCAFCLQDVSIRTHECHYKNTNWRKGNLCMISERIVDLLRPLSTDTTRLVLNNCSAYFKDLDIGIVSIWRSLNAY